MSGRSKGRLDMSKDNKILRNVCLVSLIAGTVYGLILPFCWHNDPFDTYGTLSILCEDRKLFFWFWVLLDCGSLALNCLYMYKKYGAAKQFNILPALTFVSACCIALTLGHDVTTWNPKRIVHWIATGVYIAMLAASVALFALSGIRRGRFYRGLLAAVAASLACFLVIFAVFGKSGIMEMVPNVMMQITLFVCNFIIKPDRGTET